MSLVAMPPGEVAEQLAVLAPRGAMPPLGKTSWWVDCHLGLFRGGLDFDFSLG